ncbi:MAG: di-heme oxidoredictase family protein [Planctomycetota bacterium]
MTTNTARSLALAAAIGLIWGWGFGTVALGQPQPKLGNSVNGLSPAEETRFSLGKAQFTRNFNDTEGLGPGFNQTGCSACHNAPVVGGSGITSVTRFGSFDKINGFQPLDSLGGSLLQANAINMSCLETVPAIANVTAFRITTSSFGIGLIEAIPDSAIVANETAQNTVGSLVTGHVHWVPRLEDPMGPLRAGRFGWKAQLATVLSFSGDATLMEMGITNALVSQENSPNGDPALLALCDLVADPEDLPDALGVTFIERVTDFQRFLGPPPQTPRSGMSGEAIFDSIGCVTCHVRAYTTGTTTEPALSNQQIQPYSDFLVHDMGALGDGIVQGDALDLEMRTPPLWGVRWRDALLHDGRVAAGTFESRMAAAILEHSGEAFASQAAFSMLTAAEQAQLFAFLNSLGRHEFDHDDNIFIDYSDFVDFWSCFTGPGVFYTADEPCALHDVDQDGDVDADDFAVFLQVYEGGLVDCDGNGTADMIELVDGTAADCNGNATPDACDIAGGVPDLNGNLVPDSCEFFVRGDCNVDGSIDIADAVLGLGVLFMGSTSTCTDGCDNNDDGAHDIADPIYLVSHLFSSGSPAPMPPYPACGPDGDDSDTLAPCSNPNCP